MSCLGHCENTKWKPVSTAFFCGAGIPQGPPSLPPSNETGIRRLECLSFLPEQGTGLLLFCFIWILSIPSAALNNHPVHVLPESAEEGYTRVPDPASEPLSWGAHIRDTPSLGPPHLLPCPVMPSIGLFHRKWSQVLCLLLRSSTLDSFDDKSFPVALMVLSVWDFHRQMARRPLLCPKDWNHLRRNLQAMVL